jgi:hypothetical protein
MRGKVDHARALAPTGLKLAGELPDDVPLARARGPRESVCERYFYRVRDCPIVARDAALFDPRRLITLRNYLFLRGKLGF